MPQELAALGDPYLGYPLASPIFGSRSPERDTQKARLKKKWLSVAEIWLEPIDHALTKAENENTRTSQSGRLRSFPRPPRPTKGSQHPELDGAHSAPSPNVRTPRECGWRHGDRVTRRAGVTRMALEKPGLGQASSLPRSQRLQHPIQGGGGGPPRQLGGEFQLRGQTTLTGKGLLMERKAQGSTQAQSAPFSLANLSLDIRARLS